MKKTLLTFLSLFLAPVAIVCGQSVSNVSNASKMKFLIHVTQSAENPTVAALAFLVAKTALEEGHSVSIFLAGDAVKLLQEPTLNSVEGLGTGKLREHYDAIIKRNGRFYLSGNSSKARGVTEENAPLPRCGV